MEAELEQTLEKYNERLTEKPKDTRTLCNRSFILLKLEKYDEALQDAEFVTSLDKNLAKGHLRRAQALEKLGRETEALYSVSKALDLDANDESGLRLLLKLDTQLQAGTAVVDKLKRDAIERRSAVRAILQNEHQVSIFQDKWAQLECTQKKLILRMLHRGLEEIKQAFVDAFQPLESVLQTSKNSIDLNLLQQEILAATIVVSSDIVHICDSDEDRIAQDEKHQDRTTHTILDCIKAAAQERENCPQVCGDGMFSLMNAYRFPAFRRHPRQAELSLELIKLHRSTLLLVVAHLLLGGDGLPTVARQSEEFFKVETDALLNPNNLAEAKHEEDKPPAFSRIPEEHDTNDDDDEYSDDLCSPQSDDSGLDQRNSLFSRSFISASAAEAK